MKKTIFTKSVCLALSAVMAAGAMTGCSKKPAETQAPAETTAAAEAGQTEAAETEAAQAEGTRVEGGECTIMIQTEPDSFDPFIAVAADTESILFNVYDGLVTLGDDGTMHPDLAEKYEVSEDHKTYTFYIKDSATFSNGEPVTVDDVVASYTKYKDVKAGFEQVESIEGGDGTVTFTLTEPDASFISILNYGVAPADESIDLNITPIGSGPYMITDYVTGSEVVLEKNPYYATNEERTPNMDKITVKVNMTDPAVTLNQFLAGDIDLTQFMEPENAAIVEKKGGQVIAAPSNTIQILAFNLNEAPFDDVRVRQAMAYAIDKDALVETILCGQSDKLISHMSPVMAAYYTEDIENAPYYDPEKAKELLKEAGYDEGELSFTIKVPSSYSRHVNTGLMIKDMLADIGVNAEIEQIEWATWLEDVYADRKFQSTIIGMAGKVDPDKVFNRYETTFKRNMWNYSNPEYDKLIAEGKRETELEKRVEIYKQCQQYLVDDAVCVYTMDTSNIKFANAKLGGIKNYPAYYINMSALYWME